MSKPTVLIIGGGAAGFFAACLLAEKHSNIKITMIISYYLKYLCKYIKLNKNHIYWIESCQQ